ncbi:MBL fold metallo-hydrolase, partial [Burkholderia pseudomallei]
MNNPHNGGYCPVAPRVRWRLMQQPVAHDQIKQSLLRDEIDGQ